MTTVDFSTKIKGIHTAFRAQLTSFITRFYKMLTLPPIELIEIEGKKYRKEEVFEKLKDLKTY